MTTTPLYIFISSKMRELAAERQTLHKLLPTLGNDLVKLQPWGFEDDAPASSASIRRVYLDALKRSALYIGLFWNDYGEWTIDEFKRASEWAIDRHIYVKDVDADKRDPALQAFLDEQSDVISGITPKWFTSVDDLAEQVRKSIEIWLKDRLMRHPGDTSANLIEFSVDIPDLPGKLIGRDSLLNATFEQLSENVQVLLQGFGGMGKSALAATVAARWIDEGKGLVLWLRAGSEDANSLFEALARPFDAQDAIGKASGSAKMKAVRDLLAGVGPGTLLVLEDVWDGTALNQVLKAVPRSMPVLVTSRQRYAMDHILEVGKLGEADALRVLEYYAHEAYAKDELARELCHQLGNHAFALEIAGKTLRVDQITPGELLKRITVTPHDLVMPEDFAEEGRTSITELLNASLYVLDEPTRQVFLAFGALFAPSATPELLARYLHEDEAQVKNALTLLQRRGLAEVVKEAEPGVVAYRIHDLAYSYARTIFEARGQGHQQSITACLDYVRTHENDLKALDAEQANILGAAQASRETGDKAVLVEMMHLLSGHYVVARGYTPRLLELLDAAITITEEQGQSKARHFLLGKRGNAYYDRGDLPQALDCYEAALELARKLGLRDREVISLCSAGKVLVDQRTDDQATARFEQADQIARDMKDDFLLGFVLEHRGYRQIRGDYQATRAIFAEEAVLGERIGDIETQFFALLNLGSAEQVLGNLTQALICHQRALGIAQAQDNNVWMGHAFLSIGEDYHLLENREMAQQCLNEALTLFRESGLQVKVNEVEAYMKASHYSVELKGT